MQDKTIDNALIALCRRCDHQSDLARQILAIRGVPVPVFQDRPLSRRQSRLLALSMLPCTSSDLADEIAERVPGIPRKSATQRAYMALRRLEDEGVVRREGGVWSIFACSNEDAS